jgi:hypothetical protein
MPSPQTEAVSFHLINYLSLIVHYQLFTTIPNLA